MEERGARMGLTEAAPELAPVVQGRGFVTTSVDNLMNWARTGSLLADDLRPRLLRGRDDARGRRAL